MMRTQIGRRGRRVHPAGDSRAARASAGCRCGRCARATARPRRATRVEGNVAVALERLLALALVEPALKEHPPAVGRIEVHRPVVVRTAP